MSDVKGTPYARPPRPGTRVRRWDGIYGTVRLRPYGASRDWVRVVWDDGTRTTVHAAAAEAVA